MTYLGLNAAVLALVLAGAAVLLVLAARRRLDGLRSAGAAIALTALALLVLTVVFDSLMIAADLFRYDPEHLVGLRAWLAPVEDLAWPLAAAVGLPALWVWLGAGDDAAGTAAGRTRSGGPRDADPDAGQGPHGGPR